MWESLGIAAGGAVIDGIAGKLFGGDDGGFSIGDTRDAYQLAYDQDKKLTRYKPSWMVDGANRAGIHPALMFGGSNFMSPSPIAINSSPGMNHFSGIGQDLSRAYLASRSSREREEELQKQTAYAEEANRLNLDNMRLQNDLLASQISSLNSQLPPPSPDVTIHPLVSDPVIGRSIPNSVTIDNAYQVDPARITSRNSSVPSLTAGPSDPAFKKWRIGGPNLGGSMELPAGQTFSESLESMGAPYAMATSLLHNTLRPLDRIIYGGDKPTQKLPSTHIWRWNRFKQTWEAHPKNWRSKSRMLRSGRSSSYRR